MTKRTDGRDVRTSTKRARVLNELRGKQETELERMKKENKTLKNAMAEMQLMLEESEKKLIEMESVSPIKEIGKIHDGQRGSTSWPLYVWELILEQLINGTPPSAVNDNIRLHVEMLSPKTKIRELPSIWTIRRARTVLLVICQSLAAYRLTKAGKWHHLFTDATGWRQVTFQNLIISIEDDELFQ